MTTTDASDARPGARAAQTVRTALLVAYFAVGAGAALAFGAGAALAQVPGLPKALQPAAGSPVPGAEDKARDGGTIAKDLAAAKADLKAIEDSPDRALGAPAGTPAAEIGDRLTLARQLAANYQQQQDTLARGEVARTQRAEIERTAKDWTGFATPPPLSVLTVDALRDRKESADAQVANAQNRIALINGFIDQLGSKVKASQTAARLAAEAADGARGTPDEARLEWQRQLAALRARADIATQDVLQISGRSSREELAAAEAARDFAQRQLAAAGHDLAFPADEVTRVDNEIAARRRGYEAALAKAVRAYSAANDARAAAENALAAARAAPVPPGEDPAARTRRLDELAAALDVRREQVATGAIRVDLLKGILLSLDGEQSAWRQRAEALGAHDPMRRRAIYEKLASGMTTIHAWRDYLQQQLQAVKGKISEQEARLRSGDAADAAQAQQLLETYNQQQANIQMALDGVQPLERLLARFRDDVEARRDVSLQERARDALAAAALFARRLWNFELFTVADTFQTAEGRQIDVERSVTIGKSVGAVLVVVLGYWLAGAIVRRIEKSAVRRGKLPAQSAALLRNWIMFFVGAILVMFALVSASIPLTAFAFLGGALAIAAGFGLQTLLKNFVAGLMILYERPMRLGDLVEVDGFRGRITSIGIRASTIMSADGIETMIPNSAFVENKLTNWTYSNPEARQTVTIGVNYGSPLRRTGDVLLDVLKRHGQVLKSPEPQVYLDDYADSSVVFVLTYWLDMRPGIDSRRVKSDILQMIDTAFSDAGIAMPFPQRDVHLDATTPIRVEVVAPAGK